MWVGYKIIELEETNGSLGESPSRGSQQGRHTGSCQPHTGTEAPKSPLLPCTGRPDPG